MFRNNERSEEFSQTRTGGAGQRPKQAKVLALATVTAFTAVGGSLSAAVLPPGTAPVAAEGAAPDAGAKRFQIAPGPLDAALEQFRHQAGIAVSSEIPADKLAGFRSIGVSGVLAPEAALQSLLAGTGLTAYQSGADEFTVGLRHAESVEVTSSVGSVGIQQFTEPVLDTAQTVVAVPHFILQDQQDTTLRDALRNVPGISLAAGEGGSQGDNLTIRGFTARNDIFLDGIRDFGSYYRDAFDYDSVDVLEGPAGVEFGRGSTGGVVNQESRQPGPNEHIGGTLQLGSNLMRRVTVDLNEPIKALPGAAFRLDLAGEESSVAERNNTNVRRFGIAPSLALGLNGPTRFFLTYLHEGEDDLPDYGIPYFGAGAPAIARQTYFGFAENNYLRTNPDVVTGRAEHDFSPYFTLRNTLRWANYPRDVNITEPQINTTPVYSLVGGVPTATCSPTAATPCYTLNTPLNQIQVKRNQITVNSTEDMLWNQTIGSGHFSYRGIGNDFMVIAEGGRERSRPQRPTYTYSVTSAYYTPLTSPNARDYEPAPTALPPRIYVNSQSYGFGFNDTLKLRSWLQLSGGVRFDYFNTDYVNPTLTATPHLARLDHQPTYRAAVVVKPRPAGSIYFDYGTSFNPSAESLSLSANNALQPPQYNETYETGAKWSFLRDRLNLNGSWFQTVKTNVSETDPNNSANIIQVGPQRVRGVQVGALGHLPQHFDVILGYAYLNGITVGSQQNYSPFAAYYKNGDPVYGQYPFYIRAVGNPFANVPKNSANLFVTHSLGFGFVGGFGFNQVSARRASSTGPVVLPQTSAPTPVTALPFAFKVIPGYVTFNAMLRRPISDRLTFQANVNNLTNAFFIDLPHPNHLIPSEGINSQFGLNYSF